MCVHLYDLLDVLDLVDELHQLDPVHQVDHKDEHQYIGCFCFEVHAFRVEVDAFCVEVGRSLDFVFSLRVRLISTFEPKFRTAIAIRESRTLC